MDAKNSSFDRRLFLKSLALALVARDFAGCSSSSGPASGKDGGTTGETLDAPFGVWRAMREALRVSPDSLADRAAVLVRAKDAHGLFEFVRDQIATLPPVTAATEKSRRWGAVAALRGGAGTPRERADLLALLLTQAGFRASVVMGDPADALARNDAPATIYLRTVDRTFEPGPPPAGIKSWVRALTGADTAPEPEVLDPTGASAQALFDAIMPLLPASVSAPQGALVLFNVPLVALEQQGTTTYLNPLLPNAAFGTPYATNIGPAPAADPLPTVEATLLISRASGPETQVPVVSATYTVDQLVGRQLVLQTQPSGTIEELILSPLESVVAFIPTISVAGVDLTAAQRAELTTTGSWITQSGDVLERAPDGTILCNGLSLGKGGSASASSVASVQVQVNASAFPQIELFVTALDAHGQPVAGLGANAFQISEDGAPVPFVMRDNGVTGPRALFLVDTTGSQPAISSTWANAVAQALFAAAPDASAQVVNLSAASASSTGYVLTSAASVATALTTLSAGLQSNLYQAMLGAEAAAPTLIVLMSDGNAEDADLKTRAMTELAGGAPVLAITCSKTLPVAASPVMDAFATASGGKSVNGADLTDPTLCTKPFSTLLGTRVTSPYRLSYTAPLQGASTRAVNVTANAKGTTNYAVPAQPGPAAAVAGLYLKLKLENSVTSSVEEYTRVLGGWVPGSDPSIAGTMDAAISDARAAMLGSAVISFEGAPPTLSTWLSDSLAWRLATEPASQAFAKGDVKAAFAALAGVPASFPREAVPLHAQLLGVSNAVVYEEALRAVLFCLRAKNPPYHADILPFTRLMSASPSPSVDAFRTNLLASLRLAISESAAFQTSTVSLLKGKTLKLLNLGGVSVSDLPQMPKAQALAFANVLNQYSGWYRLIATDGSTQAFWAIHPHGSCLGVLPDGSGGGEDPCGTYKRLANMLDMLALFSDILGVPTLSIWAEIGKLVALAGVETILAFNYTPVTVTPEGQVGALGCSIASGLLGAAPVTHAFKQVGVVTLVTNFFQASTINTVVGEFSVCDNSPCK